jgi:hypothetical protein
MSASKQHAEVDAKFHAVLTSKQHEQAVSCSGPFDPEKDALSTQWMQAVWAPQPI